MDEQIVNKVANSGLVNFDLEDYYVRGPRKHIDLKDQLYMGLILKEKDFREWIKNNDWSAYAGCYVSVNCTEDAIVPVWAFMLVASALAPYAKKVVFGDSEQLETALYKEVIDQLDTTEFADQRLIIKGCGNLPVPRSAFVMLTAKLQPIAKSVMYGEACSTVPIYKKTSQ